MNAKNVSSVDVGGTTITTVITNKEQLQTCDKTKSIATVSVLKRMILENRYPIGSVYMNYLSNANPNTILGFGTWQKITNKYVYATDSTTGTGGYDKIQAAMLPAHKHSVNISYSSGAGKHTHTINIERWWDSNDTGSGKNMASHDQDGEYILTNWEVSYPGNHTHTLKGNTSDYTEASVKNLPAYQSLFMWYRTA